MALTHKIRQQFIDDYINEVLPKMPKWTESKPSLKVGEMVLMCDDHMKRHSWPLARVSAILPSKHTRAGEIRTVKVFDGKRHHTRAVQKLAKLELPDFAQS